MRKVTQTIKEAWLNGEAKTVSNTHTDGNSVWLHGNQIIKVKENGEVWATLAGWDTPTTKERVNGITNAGFHTVNFETHINGVPVDDDEWIFIDYKTEVA